MKKRILACISITLIVIIAFTSISNNSGVYHAFATNGKNIWHHYVMVSPTEQRHGSREFWALEASNCEERVFEEPSGDKFVEHDFSNYESFGQLAFGDERYIPSLFDQRNGVYPLDNCDGTISYGIYPQTNVKKASLITRLNSLTEANENGWYLYNGQYYAKLIATPYESGYKFDNNVTIISGKTYWFKCEPIIWRILNQSGHSYALLSNVLLDLSRYYNSTNDRQIDGKIIYPNNYVISDIRNWLNNTFIDTAFRLSNLFIRTASIDNSASTTDSIPNSYESEKTNDKIFLLSYQNYISLEYGFSSSKTSSITRVCKATDYARARGAYVNNKYSNYWTRSPASRYSDGVCTVYYDGYIDTTERVTRQYNCVRPAIEIRL